MNNQIMLAGHVGQAPITRSIEGSDNKVVKFSIAVEEYFPNSEAKKTLWIDVDAWNGVGDRVLKAITKGREVVVIGRLAIAHFNKEINGVIVPVTKPVVKLTSFHLCGKKPVAEEETTLSVLPSTKKQKLASVKD